MGKWIKDFDGGLTNLDHVTTLCVTAHDADPSNKVLYECDRELYYRVDANIANEGRVILRLFRKKEEAQAWMDGLIIDTENA